MNVALFHTFHDVHDVHPCSPLPGKTILFCSVTTHSGIDTSKIFRFFFIARGCRGCPLQSASPAVVWKVRLLGLNRAAPRTDSPGELTLVQRQKSVC